jgi:hypothetical protein
MSSSATSVGKNRLVDDVVRENTDKSLELENSIGEDVVIQ